ncbi:lysine exporter LysO family protein [Thermococcus nautili]|uniref:Putative membrane protein n=1 Tax=Thermococcus nautili TaxID=195522 RepID=W8NZE0_9EURY|nr:lysine exporter LysO family protein [Thermococcus nautili]AHL21806.1 putative membrane protein [Thermococcus nautili]
MRFLHLVLASLTVGILVGRFFSPDFGNAYEIMLYILIFVIGADLGLNFNAEELRRVGRKALTLPFLTLTGSILGGLLAALILGIEPRWGLAIGAGCGWYSLTGPLIAQYSAVYGAVGFLGNLLREILTITFYPLVTQKIGPEKAVVMGGATTMDTTLPIITKFGGREVALVAFVHGFILTAVVPFLVPLILSL